MDFLQIWNLGNKVQENLIILIKNILKRTFRKS